MTVRHLVDAQKARKAPFCASGMTVFDAAVEIAELGVNALAVVDDGKLTGIITDHDIIRALADTGTDLGEILVSQWKTPKVVTCSSDDRLADALNKMARYRIRHLVAVEANRPVAVIGARDVLTRIHESDVHELRVLQDLARAKHATQGI